MHTHTYRDIHIYIYICVERYRRKPCRCPRASNSCAKWVQAGALLDRQELIKNSPIGSGSSNSDMDDEI